MITYREAKECDYHRINEFHNKLDKPNRSFDLFEWEFLNCPFGKAIYVIAEDGDKIVGTNCVIPIELRDNTGKKVLSGKSEDTLVDPDYRGQNIFNGIYQFLFECCKEKDIEIIWGFTPAIKPFQKLGFETPFYQYQGLFVLQTWKSFNILSKLNPKNKIMDLLKILSLSIISKFISCFSLFFKRKSIRHKASYKLDIEGINALTTRTKNGFTLSINRNEDYLKWRISENPYYQKIVPFSFYDSSKNLIGYLIFNVTSDGIAYLIDSFFDESIQKKECSEMINFCLHQLNKDKEIVMIRTWFFETTPWNKNEIEIFKASGLFYLKKSVNSIVWKNIGPFNYEASDFQLTRITSQGIN